MTIEKWLIKPGESRVIDLEDIRKLKIGLVGGQVDVVAHDEPGVRIEVHAVTGKDLRIEASGDVVEIDHAQLRWDNFLEVFRNFGAAGPKAEVSVAVPRGITLNLGVVSASALVSGLRSGARLNTVSGEVAATGSIRKATIDTVSGDLLVDSTGRVDTVNLNTVSGESTVRLDAGHAANYVLRSVSGRVLVDGIKRSSSGPTNWVDSDGELSGSFVDVRVNSVSGAITVLRRAASVEHNSFDEVAPHVDEPALQEVSVEDASGGASVEAAADPDRLDGDGFGTERPDGERPDTDRLDTDREA